MERNFVLGIEPFRYGDLYDRAGLTRLQEVFEHQMSESAPDLWADVGRYRKDPTAFTAPEESELLIRVAQRVGPFLAKLFRVESEWRALIDETEREAVLYAFKRDFMARRVHKRFKAGEVVDVDEPAYLALEAKLGSGRTDSLPGPDSANSDEELRAARTAMALFAIHQLFERPSDGTPEDLARAERSVASLAVEPTGDAKADLAKLLDIVERWHGARLGRVHWMSYHQPKAFDAKHAELVELKRPSEALQEAIEGPEARRRRREGFGLTDRRMSRRDAMAEVAYCIYCHDRERDSCRNGLHEKSGAVKKNPLGIPLDGCPLDERISEAHLIRKDGDVIGALSMIMLDNPMCPGTGHRICNDCMKSCIYQKQEPVNIPQAETRILTDTLHLPYGFEIYSLLTRWNPVNLLRPIYRPYRGVNVLVVGLGPAGYTLSHHLMNEGFGVVAIDGLKIEPLAPDLLGKDMWPPRAVRDYDEIEEELDQRIMLGFGGVAEYGITSRWDKNFLKVIYLTLARRDRFHFYDGVRFGGTITIEDAWNYGFDHVAIAAGAGKPTIVDMKNNLITGMRQASDFLMALQLTGAAKKTSLANLQVELPAVVIGGGLTAIDTATELAAYYPVQIEKLLERTESLGEEKVLSTLNPEEKAIFSRMIAHAKELREEKKKPTPNVASLVRKWGGVSIAYRRSLLESPAYRLNHEEVEKALEEGITFIENLTPFEAVPDEHGHIQAIRCKRRDKSEITLPARSVMIAAGTTPNTIYARECPGTIELDDQKKFFRAHKVVIENGTPKLVRAEPGEDAFFTSYSDENGRFISYYGDNHPKYAGNVVKAMASALRGHKHVVELFENRTNGSDATWQALKQRLDDDLLAVVHEVTRLTPTIVEVVVRAPAQARKFEPGQFYRFQNYESASPLVRGTRLQMEGIALTGAWVDKQQGLLSVIALEIGVSSRLCSTLKKGERVVVMGPTGAPTEIPSNETVILVGGGLGNAVLFSVAKALRNAGNKVLYFAGYKKPEDVFKREEIEAATDQVVWAVDAGTAIQPRRPQDRNFVGNIVQAMRAYADGTIADPMFRLQDATRIIAIGSDRMMAAVTKARHTVLSDCINPAHEAIASINSPMQCMMKEVCAQCLQRHVDPKTGAESFVFSCFNQDQRADHMDWNNLAARLRQNSLLEKVANLWFERLLPEANVSHV